MTGPRPLRVGYVLSRFPQISETFILREMEGLEQRGHDVTVIAPVLDRSAIRHPGADRFVATMVRARSPFELIAAQLHWLRRDPRRYGSVWWDALRGNRSSPAFVARAAAMVLFAALVARRIEARADGDMRIDRLHAHYATHSLLCAWAISRLVDVPYGVTCHAHDLYVNRTMLREKLTHASPIVTISEFNRRLIEETCGHDIGARTTVIHCGVDTDAYTPPQVEPAGTFRFLVIGSLQPYKGHEVLLEAFAEVETDERIELVIVGDGELRANLEAKAAALGIADRTTFRGQLAAPAVRRELRYAHCVVQPSVVTGSGKMEGIPVALMEALACGRPVIASDLSGVSELVRDGDTGVLVAPGDPHALATAMRSAIAEPESQLLMAKRGRALVEAEFELDHQIDRFCDRLHETDQPREQP